MVYGYGILIEDLLYMFSMLPLRSLVSLYDALILKHYTKQFYMDWLKLLSIIINGILIVNYCDYTSIYHYIRVDSIIKLTVIYNFARMFERYISNIGHDMYDNMILVHEQQNQEEEEQVVEEKDNHDKLQSSSISSSSSLLLLFKFTMSFILHTVYLFIHTSLQLIKCACLNLAFNSNDMSGIALMTVIIANNYLELKTNILKKSSSSESLFPMVCNDLNERFQFIVYTSMIGIMQLQIGINNNTSNIYHWIKFIVST